MEREDTTVDMHQTVQIQDGIGIPVITLPSNGGVPVVTIANSIYREAPASFSHQHEIQHLEDNPSVAVVNLEQCCICSVLYEQISRPIPQVDLNRIVCKLLDVVPDSSFYRNYVSFCVNCAHLLKKFNGIWVELEFIKTQVVTHVVETLTEMRSEGGIQLECLKTQILNRWCSVPRRGYIASQTEGLCWATHNNITKNATIIEPSENWNVGSEVIVNSTPTPMPPITHPSPSPSPPPSEYTSDHENNYMHSTRDENSEHKFCGESKSDENRSASPVSRNELRISSSPINEISVITSEDLSSPLKKRRKVRTSFEEKKLKISSLSIHICTTCGRLYDSVRMYNAHVQACTTDDFKQDKNCTVCSKELNRSVTFVSWEAFKEHVYENHSTAKLERCTFCRWKFLPNGIEFHNCPSFQRQVDVDPIFKCDRCDRAYNSRANLTDHVRRCHKDEQHTCSTCGKVYGSPMLLKLHENKHQLVVSKWQCKECNVCLSSNFSLKQHMKRHAGDLQFECTICGRKFLSKTIYTNHKMVHSNLKPHACNICGTRFKLKVTLKRHIARHEVNETNYTKKCPLCPKLHFRKIWCLKLHMETQHPESPECQEILEKYKDVNDIPIRTYKSTKTNIEELDGTDHSDHDELTSEDKFCSSNTTSDKPFSTSTEGSESTRLIISAKPQTVIRRIRKCVTNIMDK